MNRIIFIAICILMTTNAYSQTSNSFKYHLKILEESRKPLYGILVRVMKGESISAFDMNTSDSTGSVSFILETNAEYLINIYDSNYSFFKKQIPSTNLHDLSDTLTLHRKAFITDEIQVEAQKEFMEIHDEKTIFNISKLGSNQGANALELMRRIPMVMVENETVLIRGYQPKILVNGRPSDIYGNLKSIPTDLIEKVEVMTIPPSKYANEGAAGVINIILKHFEEAKYRVYSYSILSSNNSISSYVGGNFKKNNLSFFTNLSGDISARTTSNFLSTRNTTLNELTTISTDTITSNSKFLNISTGLIYDLNPRLYMGLEGVMGLNPSKDRGKTTKQYSFENFLLQTLSNNNNSDFTNYSLVGYINKKELSSKDELSVEFNLNNSSYNTDNLQAITNTEVLVPFYSNATKVSNEGFVVKFDYTKKIDNSFNFETGLRSTQKKESNAYSFSDTLTSSSSTYEFKQNIYSYYGTVSYVVNSIRIKSGIGIEYADLRGMTNTGSEFTNYKLDIFPSFSVTKIFDNTQVHLNYNKRIDRPRFNTLNPFVIKKDIYNTVSGNPDLQPSYVDNFELRFSTPIGKVFLNSNLYYRHNANLIQSVRQVDSIYTHTTFENNGFVNEYGVDGGINAHFSDNFYINVYGTVNKNVFSDATVNLQSDRIYYNCNLSAGYSKADLFDVNLSFFYSGNRFTPNRINNSYIVFYFNALKYFMNRKLSIGVNVNNPFHSSNSESRFVLNGFEQINRFSGSSDRSINLFVNFIFGNYDESRQKGKEIKGNDYDN